MFRFMYAGGPKSKVHYYTKSYLGTKLCGPIFKVRSNLLQRPLVYKDHLLIIPHFTGPQGYTLYVIEPA